MSSETTPLSSTPRTTLRRHRERAQADRAALYEVLDAGLICHFGVVADGDPVVLPTAYGRDGDTLYLHGSSANGAFWAADGNRVCVTVTHIDGLVAARSVFSHSVNYRSAVIFGTATIVKTRMSAGERCGSSPTISSPAGGRPRGSPPPRRWRPRRCCRCRSPRPR